MKVPNRILNNGAAKSVASQLENAIKRFHLKPCQRKVLMNLIAWHDRLSNNKISRALAKSVAATQPAKAVSNRKPAVRPCFDEDAGVCRTEDNAVILMLVDARSDESIAGVTISRSFLAQLQRIGKASGLTLSELLAQTINRAQNSMELPEILSA